MTDDRWTAVDHYVDDLLVGADPALQAALEATAAAGMPAISVSPSQGKLLHLLARAMGARRILELGTLGGYSAIWLARALPAGGRLITIEAKPEHADVARASFARANVSNVIDLRVGPALDVLPRLAAEAAGPFDLIFIDADKPNYPQYLDWSITLARPGTLIIADNVVRDGDVVDERSTDPMVQGARQFNARLAADPRVTSTIVQTVGSKGYDGFAVALVASLDED
ncbi:MAG TPA: O-methyltransferase [Vicinamibacterales bacterium]|nr:O-methyltransferase [Vicinamibacterales bacterium]